MQPNKSRDAKVQEYASTGFSSTNIIIKNSRILKCIQASKLQDNLANGSTHNDFPVVD